MYLRPQLQTPWYTPLDEWCTRSLRGNKDFMFLVIQTMLILNLYLVNFQVFITDLLNDFYSNAHDNPGVVHVISIAGFRDRKSCPNHQPFSCSPHL